MGEAIDVKHLVAWVLNAELPPADQRILTRPDSQLAQSAFATLRQQAMAAGRDQLDA